MSDTGSLFCIPVLLRDNQQTCLQGIQHDGLITYIVNDTTIVQPATISSNKYDKKKKRIKGGQCSACDEHC